MTVQACLWQTWLENLKTGFLASQLICFCFCRCISRGIIIADRPLLQCQTDAQEVRNVLQASKLYFSYSDSHKEITLSESANKVSTEAWSLSCLIYDEAML